MESSTERDEYLQQQTKEIQDRLRRYRNNDRYRAKHKKKIKKQRAEYLQRFKAENPELYAEINRNKRRVYRENHLELERQRDRDRYRKLHPVVQPKGRKPKPVQNNLGETFISAKMAAQKYGVHESAIVYACRRAKHTCCGLSWQYVLQTPAFVVQSSVVLEAS